MDKGSFAYSDLEDYIDNLTTITSTFLLNICNNLTLRGFKEDIFTRMTEEIMDQMIILSPPTSDYNCHGWSLGTVANIPYFSTKTNFLNDALLYKEQPELLSSTDKTISTFFNTLESSLIETDTATEKEGNIAIYLESTENIIHTARYVKNIDWYKYDEDSHGQWYSRHTEGVIFDASGNNCTIDSYTSKLGLGYLVAHKLEDIVP